MQFSSFSNFNTMNTVDLKMENDKALHLALKKSFAQVQDRCGRDSYIACIKTFTNTTQGKDLGTPVLYCSVTHSRLTLCDPMNCSKPHFSVLHQLLELAQTHVHWVDNAIQPSHPPWSSSPALSLPQHQGLFKWVISSHQVAKLLELQLQHQSFQEYSGLISFKTD